MKKTTNSQTPSRVTDDYSGLAILLNTLYRLAEKEIKQLGKQDLSRLESAAECAIFSLSGIQASTALIALQVDEKNHEELQQNNIPYKLNDFHITAAECFDALQGFKTDFAYIANHTDI